MTGIAISHQFDPTADCVLFQGDCLDLLAQIPDEFVQLVVTSPPYNLGKPYESQLELNEYLREQRQVIEECVRALNRTGSICWQVGNYVENGEIIPLDIVLYPIFASLGLHLRNRIVWHFGHGLHASRRFSGRYEVILWFTKGNDYTFDLDAVRVPQKYPHKKYFKGPKKGQLSGHPLGKNPGDIWEIPNVKANHVEKTIHPCQFPVELIERLVLALTQEGDWVLDPFMGVGTTAVAALIHQRRAIGAEIIPEYMQIARERIALAEKGQLRIRPMQRPVYDPDTPRTTVPPQFVQIGAAPLQPALLEERHAYDVGERQE
ncbi:MAG: site-specific DNA-methyltransferase [Acidobacteria bacterium]|nr:site-specific DNA-methyltransferase [Acidobacteriota bacterium]